MEYYFSLKGVLMYSILLKGEIDVNCYFLISGFDCYIVDPGYEKEKVISYVSSRGLNVLGILLTHSHIDHIGAIDCFKVPVYLHKDGLQIINDDDKNGFSFYGRVKSYSLKNIEIVTIDDSKTFNLGNDIITVIHTPGHTPGSVCYKLNSDLYTGDTLFRGSVGRWDFPMGSKDTLKNSIVNLIDNQSVDITIHPSHGDSSTIKEERDNNQFYYHWKRGIDIF